MLSGPGQRINHNSANVAKLSVNGVFLTFAHREKQEIVY
jgi:hypothetical protein